MKLICQIDLIFYQISQSNKPQLNYNQSPMRISSLFDEQSSIVPCYKVIILGMGKAGKTKLLTRYRYGNYVDQGSQTMIIDCFTVSKNKARYYYYDTLGQERYRSVLDLYFKGSDAAILVYSVDSMQSFQELEYYFQKLQTTAPQCKLYFAGCKNDLKKAVHRQLVMEKYKGAKYYETSAKMNQGVNQLFNQIETDLLAIKKQKTEIFQLQMKKKNEVQKKKCCKDS